MTIHVTSEQKASIQTLYIQADSESELDQWIDAWKAHHPYSSYAIDHKPNFEALIIKDLSHASS